jgi:hypothetical protein
MWRKTPISTPTILGIICLLLLTIWRKDSESRFRTLESLLKDNQRSYDTLTRTLLGVPPDSQPQTVTMSRPPSTSEPSAPDEMFGDLPMDDDLTREYQEFLARTGTLSGQPARTNPEVPQLDLSNPRNWPSVTG